MAMRWGIWTLILPMEEGKEFTISYAAGATILGLGVAEHAGSPFLFLWGDMDPEAEQEGHRFVWQRTGENTVYKPWKWIYRGTITTTDWTKTELFLFEY